MFYYIFSNTISKQLSTLLSWFESKKLYCLTGAVRKKASKNEQKNYIFLLGRTHCTGMSNYDYSEAMVK